MSLIVALMKNPNLRNSNMGVPDTHEETQIEKFKCMCVKQFPQLLETLSFQILRSLINLHCFLSN